MLSRRLDGRRSWLEVEIPFRHLARAAHMLHKSVGDILIQLQKFIPLGLIVLEADSTEFLDFMITEDDIALLNKVLPYRWLGADEISYEHIKRVAQTLEQSVEVIYKRLQRFEPLGLQLPSGDFGL